MRDIKGNNVWTTVVLLIVLLSSFAYAAEPQVGLPPPLPTCGDVNYGADCIQASYQVVNYDQVIRVGVGQPTADATFIFSRFESASNPSDIISGSMTYDRARIIVENMQYGPVVLSSTESADLRGAFRQVFTDQTKVPEVQKEVRVLYDQETRAATVEQKTQTRVTIFGKVIRDEKWEQRVVNADTLEQDAASARITTNNPLAPEDKRATSTTTLSAAPSTQQGVQTASASNINSGGAQGRQTVTIPGFCPVGAA